MVENLGKSAQKKVKKLTAEREREKTENCEKADTLKIPFLFKNHAGGREAPHYFTLLLKKKRIWIILQNFEKREFLKG